MMEGFEAWAETGAVGAIVLFAGIMLKFILDRLKQSDAANDKMTIMLENHLSHIKEHMAATNEAMKNLVGSQKEICQEIKDIKKG